MSDNTPNAPSDDLAVLRAQLTEAQAALEAERNTPRCEDCGAKLVFSHIEAGGLDQTEPVEVQDCPLCSLREKLEAERTAHEAARKELNRCRTSALNAVTAMRPSWATTSYSVVDQVIRIAEAERGAREQAEHERGEARNNRLLTANAYAELQRDLATTNQRIAEQQTQIERLRGACESYEKNLNFRLDTLAKILNQRDEETEFDAANRAIAQIERLREALNMLAPVLLDPDGRASISGSDGDLEIINSAFALATTQPEQPSSEPQQDAEQENADAQREEDGR